MGGASNSSASPRGGVHAGRGVRFVDAEGGYGSVPKPCARIVGDSTREEEASKVKVAGRLLAIIAVFGTLGSLLPLFAVGWVAKLGKSTLAKGEHGLSLVRGLQAPESIQALAGLGTLAPLGAAVDGTRNLLGGPLKPCSGPEQDSATGWTRTGSCAWSPDDSGYHEVRARASPRPLARALSHAQIFFSTPHTPRKKCRLSHRCPLPHFSLGSFPPGQVCVTMDQQFLESSAEKDGNDLSSVVSHGEHWCVCAWAWASAVERDPVAYEGLTLQCEESNEMLREVYRAFIDAGKGLTAPSGVSYGPEKALEAVDKLCPTSREATELGVAKARRRAANAQATLGVPY